MKKQQQQNSSASEAMPTAKPAAPERTPQPTMLSTFGLEETDMSLEKEMVDMVDDLVATDSVSVSPLPEPLEGSNGIDRLYGINPSTAALLNKLQSPDKTFPSLPWNYFLNNPGAQAFHPQQTPTTAASTQALSADIYAQIYGGSPSMSNTTGAAEAHIPGWTSQNLKTASLSPLVKHYETTQSPSAVLENQTRSPGNKWGPTSTTPSKLDPGLSQQQSSHWGRVSSKSPSSAGLTVPGKPAQTGSTSKGDYDMLYQRLANMTASQEPTKTSGSKSPTGLNANATSIRSVSSAGYDQAMSVSPTQNEPEVPGLSRNPMIQYSESSGMRRIASMNEKLPATNQWPQYGHILSSPTNIGFRGTQIGSAGTTAPVFSFGPNASSGAVPGSGVFVSDYTSGTGGLPGLSQGNSIWASTPQTYNEKIYGPVPSYGRGIEPQNDTSSFAKGFASPWTNGGSVNHGKGYTRKR